MYIDIFMEYIHTIVYMYDPNIPLYPKYLIQSTTPYFSF